jgi:hypothetical protein
MNFFSQADFEKIDFRVAIFVTIRISVSFFSEIYRYSKIKQASEYAGIRPFIVKNYD